MKKFAVVLSIPLLLSACAYFQKNPDAGEPVTDTTTQRSVNDVVACLTQLATSHNGATTYRFYAGKRHVSNLWIESAGKTCAP
jgi:hypothetical protein